MNRNTFKENAFSINKAINLFVEQNNRMTKPLETAFEYLKWLDEGRLIVIGGGSGLGKTAYVLQMLYNLVQDNQDREDGVIGIYASSEMMIEELTMRLIVNQEVLENVDITNIRKEFNTKIVSKEKVEENAKKAELLLGDIPFYFLNASRFNLKNIINLIKATREKNPNKRIFVVIDYLQLLLLDTNSLQEMNKVIKELKDCLVENKANAIAISALNRDAVKNNFVDISAFKDSSMIEYTADIAILFAFKNEKDKYTLKIDKEQREQNILEMYAYCVKNRIGKMFVEKMYFNKLKQHFGIVEQEWKGVKVIEPKSVEEAEKETEEFLTAYDVI